MAAEIYSFFPFATKQKNRSPWKTLGKLWVVTSSVHRGAFFLLLLRVDVWSWKKRSVRTRPVAVATYVKRLKGPRLLSSQAIDSLKAVISLMRRPTENAIIHSSQWTRSPNLCRQSFHSLQKKTLFCCFLILTRVCLKKKSLYGIVMGIIGEMKRDKSIGSHSNSSSGGGGGSRSGSSLSSDRPRPLSAFWGGLGKSSSSSSPKSEPVAKGFKLKHSYGGSTGHLDAYGGMVAGMGGGGMRPAVSMPVVAALPAGVPPRTTNTTSSSGNNNSKHRHHRNSLPPLIQHQHQPQQQRANQRPPSRASGLTSRMVNKKKMTQKPLSI